jgi:hypothetical protein
MQKSLLKAPPKRNCAECGQFDAADILEWEFCCQAQIWLEAPARFAAGQPDPCFFGKSAMPGARRKIAIDEFATLPSYAGRTRWRRVAFAKEAATARLLGSAHDRLSIRYMSMHLYFGPG